MIRVGVTGGIGSGKSTVCKLFAGLGVPVYDSDSRAREIMNGDGGQGEDLVMAAGGVRRAVVELLGEEAYRNGVLDAGFVAAKVFSDKMLLASLNAIVHPAVALDFEAWALSFADRPYVVLESAILFESGFDRFVDRIVTVSAPVEVRVERVMKRDGERASGDLGTSTRGALERGVASREDVLRRMENQLSDAERQAHALITIDNSGSLEELARRVQLIDKELRQ